ncbi:MAG: YlbF family regulator [Candidatus Brocadiae bacterium]|nr:YlbF family regulator [Candidatus Brocadiia bacterium]
MSLEQLARQAGRAIAATAQFRELVAAEKVFEADREARELVRIAQEDGERLLKIKSSGAEFSEKDQRQIVEVQAKISVNSSIQNLINAQRAYDALVQQVNGWVQAEVTEQRKNA